MATLKMHGPKQLILAMMSVVGKAVFATWISVKSIMTFITKFFMQLVGPEIRPFPSARTTWASILAFCAFAGLLVATSVSHTDEMRFVLCAIAALLVAAISLLVFLDYLALRRGNAGHGQAQVMRPRRNLVNTVMTLTLSIVVLTAVYYFRWHAELGTVVLQTTEKPVVSTPYPSVAFFQRQDWSSQAHLVSNKSKCGLGWIQANGSHCADTGIATAPCRCDNAFESDTMGNFTWHDVKYRYLALRSETSYICTDVSTIMVVQVFFYFNSDRAETDSSQRSSPGLYIAIHDPALTFDKALEKNFTRMTLINANGRTSINLGLRHRQAVDNSEAYDYEMAISTVPAQSVACEWDGNDSNLPGTACFASVHLQFPAFNERTIKRTQSMTWPDVIMESGGFMSFVILFAWTASGLALYAG